MPISRNLDSQQASHAYGVIFRRRCRFELIFIVCCLWAVFVWSKRSSVVWNEM